MKVVRPKRFIEFLFFTSFNIKSCPCPVSILTKFVTQNYIYFLFFSFFFPLGLLHISPLNEMKIGQWNFVKECEIFNFDDKSEGKVKPQDISFVINLQC